uniref:HMG box domain-containing protein n=1 Tax=Rhabditophanes sp. KR3021 TaxID=114890 RepID=A0AC35UDE6_9BILA
MISSIVDEEKDEIKTFRTIEEDDVKSVPENQLDQKSEGNNNDLDKSNVYKSLFKTDHFLTNITPNFNSPMFQPFIIQPLMTPNFAFNNVNNCMARQAFLTPQYPMLMPQMFGAPHFNQQQPSAKPVIKQEEREKSPKREHIKKPLNAFMCFMQANRAKYNENEEFKNKTNSEKHKEFGVIWNALPDEEKQVYKDLSAKDKTDHAIKYPDYKNTKREIKSGKARGQKRKLADGTSSSKKCRARFGLENSAEWCNNCRIKKKCTLFGADSLPLSPPTSANLSNSSTTSRPTSNLSQPPLELSQRPPNQLNQMPFQIGMSPIQQQYNQSMMMQQYLMNNMAMPNYQPQFNPVLFNQQLPFYQQNQTVKKEPVEVTKYQNL